MSELFARFGKRFAAGEVLFREGEVGDVMYILHSGAVRITKRIGDEDKPLAVLGAGEFCGEMAILNDKLRTATATVIEDTDCLVINGQTLEAMVANSTEIALRLIKKLAKRLDSADALIEILMHEDPKARVMLGLSRHAEAYGEVTDDGIRLRIKTADLAKEVAVELSIVEDVIERLTSLRLASLDEAGEICVADVDRLQDFLEFLEMPQKGERNEAPK